MQSTGVTTKDLEDLSTAWLAMRRGLPVRAGERSGPIRVAKSAKLHALGSRHLERGGADMSERRSPEAQFQLANERTYLAWLRTALALVAFARSHGVTGIDESEASVIAVRPGSPS